MAWGGLNPALTAWRNGINARFPLRGTASDGGYADGAHGSRSQHQADVDGTVDAFDMDVNLRASSIAAGDAFERRLVEALKRDFEADPRAQLWIHQREIANRDIGPWSERGYSGDNPHDKHVHWQSRQSHERDGRPWRFTHTDAVIGEYVMNAAQERKLDLALQAAREATAAAQEAAAAAAAAAAAFRQDVIPGYDHATGLPFPKDPADPKVNTMMRDTALEFGARYGGRSVFLLTQVMQRLDALEAKLTPPPAG